MSSRMRDQRKCEIELKGLHFKRFRLWLKRAKDLQPDDPMDAFISAWIAFNHYYSTYCARDEVREALYAHAKVRWGTHFPDHKQLLFLCDQEDFKKCYRVFKKENSDLFKQEILFPIDKAESLWKFSNSWKEPTSFLSAGPRKTILALYDIRSNLFHGHKDPEDERDLALCRWGASMLIALLEFLASNTTGEVLDAAEGMSPHRTAEPQPDP
jgi:hypothetical protein